jgi:dissimilatory sulfite reductase (desulfoviridin) alpha/beta subunit
MMMKLKKRLTIERSYCSRTCNCINKSEPNQKAKEEVLITTVVETRGGYGGNTAVVETAVVVETEEDINIFFQL